MAQNDIIELGVVVDVGIVPTAVVLHAQQTSSDPTGDPSEDIINAFLNSNIPTLWAARSSDQATLSCIKAQVISPTRGVATFQSTNTAGGVASVSLAPQLGAQHNWQAEPWGRNQTGWHTWPGVPVNHHSSNNLNEAGWVLEVAFAARFDSLITQTGDYEFGVWSQSTSAFAGLGFSRPRVVLKSIRTRRAGICV